MENIKIKIIKDDIIFNKIEKIYDEKYKWYYYLIISEDNSIQITPKNFNNYYVECDECHSLNFLKGNILTVIHKNSFLCRKCRNKGERNSMYGKHHSEETKAKIREYALSEDRLNIVKSKEYRKKVTEGMLNSSKLKESRSSIEYKEKLSNALKNSQKRKEVMQSKEYRDLRRKLACEQIQHNLEILGKMTLKGILYQTLILKHVNILIN